MLAGTDPDYAQRDLFAAIARAQLPKIWSQKDFPRIPVGVFELNRNPENYHADVEQAGFSPANVVPGLTYARASSADLQGHRTALHWLGNHRGRAMPKTMNNAPAINIGISDEDRAAIAGGLSKLLADTCDRRPADPASHGARADGVDAEVVVGGVGPGTSA